MRNISPLARRDADLRRAPPEDAERSQADMRRADNERFSWDNALAAMRYAIPVAVFVVLLALLAVGLTLDPRHVPSPLVDKPVPAFSLPTLAEPAETLTAETFTGKHRLLNVWASWCAACRIEHPLLVSLARAERIEIVGLNYKDTRADAAAWLKRHGNPYTRTIFDEAGSLGLDLGVYGVPETFVVDRNGIIRYKQVGPIDETVLRETILPLIEALDGGS